jgi:hypothetical protein
MNDVERLKHDAARKLQRFVNARIEAGAQTKINDPEALAVVDAISLHVIKTIEHYLGQPMERAGNGD